MLGVSNRTHFICWEGATGSKGAYVQTMGFSADRCLTSYALPIDPYSTQSALNYQNLVQDLSLPFTRSDATANHANLARTISIERRKAQGTTRGGLEGGHSVIEDDVVEEAIQSISMADYKRNVYDTSPPASYRRHVKHYSHREKYVRLLRKCPAWSQLDDTKENRMRLEGQGEFVCIVPVCVAGNSEGHH